MGLASLFDGDGERWAGLTGAITLIPLDLLWRPASLGASEDSKDSEGSTESESAAPSEETEAKGGPMTMVSPSGGGHIFSLPDYLVGALVTYGLFSGSLS